jgi:peptide/nickel transport system substrate-binding protein
MLTWVRDPQRPGDGKFVGRRRAKPLAMLGALALGVLAAGCGGDGKEAAGKPERGGELVVLENAGYEGAWPAGLDPATNPNGAANQSYMNSIFGQLFELHEGGKIVPGLAQGYKFTDGGRAVRIRLRPGVKFQDGAPFDAATVVWHIKRVLDSECTCRPTWPVKSVTAEGDDTVVLSFTRPYGAAINTFIDSNANWVASRKSLEEMGERRFRIKPVGAGPFKVVSNKLSSELVLERYAGYYRKDRPFLDKLTFKSIGGDQAAYQALQSGQAEAYEDMSTPALIEQASSNPKFTVTQHDSTSPYNVQLNTAIAPFDDKRAREAIYYATDTQAILDSLFKGRYEGSQSFTGKGGLFHQPEVEGYRNHDLAKAKEIVQELGGLEVDLGTINVLVARQTIQALQTQWEKAGIETKVRGYDLAPLIQHFTSGKWQAMLQTAGSWDPAGGVGVAFRFSSDSPFSGVHDPRLDKLLADAAGPVDASERGELYAKAAKYMSDQAYSPFMFGFAPASVVTKNVQGPGLTTKLPPVVVAPNVLWADVSVVSEGQ